MADATHRFSQPTGKERSPALPLTLTTLAGEDHHIVVDPSEHVRLHGFENAVLEQLSYLGSNSTFGCELQFVQKDTHEVLADPIQSTLRAGQGFYVLARQCFVEAVHKGQLKEEAKAIRVPLGRNDKIPPQAFSFHTEVRHVLVENGIRIVGEAAWRSCQRLQVVHLPDTVVSLRHGAFRRCYVLRAVTAPGCKQFGIKVFEACCSLTQIGTTQHSDNLLAPQAQLRPRAFEGCTALRYLNMDKAEYNPAYPNRSLPECWFLEAGIVSLPCRQILTGWDRPPVRVASSCKPLTCPEQTSSRYVARPLHSAHNCNNSASPETYES